MEYNFEAYFIWNGEFTKYETFKFVKPMYERVFVKMYNEACNALNPHYEDWNKEFDSLYPDANLKMDNDEMNPLYKNYLQNKQNEILSTLDNKVFKLYSGDECQICGKVKDFDACVFVVLKPVNK